MTGQGPGDFGSALRGERLAAGLSLGELAARVHFTKGYLSKIENGRKVAGSNLIRRCEAVLGAGGRLVAFVDDHGDTSARLSVTAPSTAMSRGGALLVRLEPDGGSSVRSVPADADTDDLIPGLAFLQTAHRSAGSTAELLACFQTMLDLLRSLGQTAGPGSVVAMLITLVHSVCGHADRARGSDARQLMLLAANIMLFTGWMAQEAGNDAAALYWTDRAAGMARRAGDRHLDGYTDVRRALMALYRDDARETVAFAGRARRAGAGHPRISGLAALRAAQGYALMGDYDSCARALDDAAEILAGNIESDSATHQSAIGTRNITDLVPVVRGWCLADLGRQREAADLLNMQMSRIPVDAHRARARFGARLALAHAQDGEVARACAVTTEVLADAMLVDSATIRVDLRGLRRTLNRWHATHRYVRSSRVWPPRHTHRRSPRPRCGRSATTRGPDRRRWPGPLGGTEPITASRRDSGGRGTGVSSDGRRPQ